MALTSTATRPLRAVADAARRRPRVALFYMHANESMLLGIAKYVRESRPWTIYRHPSAQLELMPEWLSHWEGEGIIGRIINQQTLDLVKSLGVPFVDILGAVREQSIPLVHGDDEAVGRMAAEHLIDRGFREFGYYGVPGEIWSEDRRAAFVRAVEETGGHCHVYDPPPMVSGPLRWVRAESQLADWLKNLPKPVAVMGANDDGGERILCAARRADIKVPDELAVIGVDNLRAVCEICDPPLSSVSRDFVLQGYRAAELLDRMMHGEAPPDQPIYIRPSGIVTRQSTDVLAIDDPFIAAAVSFIRQHACDGISVVDVLRQVPLSRSVLQRRFQRVLGHTVSDEIIGARIKRARQLLTETELPLSRIAEIAGFNHHQYMGSVFRKRLGMTPARFRRDSAPRRK